MQTNKAESRCSYACISKTIPAYWVQLTFMTTIPIHGVRRLCILSSYSCGCAGGRPLVIADPLGAVAQQFMTLGAAVVQEVAKLKLKPRNSVRWVCIVHCESRGTRICAAPFSCHRS